jgi:hypothetical protein
MFDFHGGGKLSGDRRHPHGSPERRTRSSSAAENIAWLLIKRFYSKARPHRPASMLGPERPRTRFKRRALTTRLAAVRNPGYDPRLCRIPLHSAVLSGSFFAAV